LVELLECLDKLLEDRRSIEVIAETGPALRDDPAELTDEEEAAEATDGERRLGGSGGSGGSGGMGGCCAASDGKRVLTEELLLRRCSIGASVDAA
jgi:hypothetical protein